MAYEDIDYLNPAQSDEDYGGGKSRPLWLFILCIASWVVHGYYLFINLLIAAIEELTSMLFYSSMIMLVSSFFLLYITWELFKMTETGFRFFLILQGAVIVASLLVLNFFQIIIAGAFIGVIYWFRNLFLGE